MTASSLYLSQFLKTRPDLLVKPSPMIIAPSYIDPSATIDPTAKIGPNVAIGPNVVIGAGVRVKDAMIFEGSTLEQHACVLHSIVGANCQIGPWARVDGEPEPATDVKGQISVTVLGELSSIHHGLSSHVVQRPRSASPPRRTYGAASSCQTYVSAVDSATRANESTEITLEILRQSSLALDSAYRPLSQILDNTLLGRLIISCIVTLHSSHFQHSINGRSEIVVTCVQDRFDHIFVERRKHLS